MDDREGILATLIEIREMEIAARESRYKLEDFYREKYGYKNGKVGRFIVRNSKVDGRNRIQMKIWRH